MASDDNIEGGSLATVMDSVRLPRLLNIAIGSLLTLAVLISQLTILRQVQDRAEGESSWAWLDTAAQTDLFHAVVNICVILSALAAVAMCIRYAASTWHSLRAVWHWLKPGLIMTFVIWWLLG